MEKTLKKQESSLLMLVDTAVKQEKEGTPPDADWCVQQMDSYFSWLARHTEVCTDKKTGWFSVSTPFVGPFNDTFTLYIKKESEESILLSDDGERKVLLPVRHLIADVRGSKGLLLLDYNYKKI